MKKRSPLRATDRSHSQAENRRYLRSGGFYLHVMQTNCLTIALLKLIGAKGQKLIRAVRIAAVVLCLCVISAPRLQAQTDPDAEARAVVIRSFEHLWQDGNFHYILNAYSIYKANGAENLYFLGYFFQGGEGDVGTDGDFHDVVTLAGAITPEELLTAQRWQIERITVDDELYLNLPVEYTTFYKTPDIAPGWWRYADLDLRLKAYQRHILDSLVQSPAPFRTTSRFLEIDSVDVGGTQRIRDVETRVYEIDIDPLPQLEHATGSGADELREALDNPRFRAASDITMHYQLWIGVEDGRLYRMLGYYRIELPYYTTGVPYNATYDYSTTMTAKYTISYWDDPLDITAPNSAVLNS